MSVTEARRLAGIRAEAFKPPADSPLPEPPQVVSPPPETSGSTASMPATYLGPAADLRTDAPPGPAAPLPGPPAPMPGRTAPAPAPAAPSEKAAPQSATPRSGSGAAVQDPLSPLRRDEAEKAQIYLSAPYPKPGLSPTFELVCRHYSPQKALQMILRRALQDYDVLLESGAFQGIAKTYALDERAWPAQSVQTSRMMEKPLLALARAHFDPHGLESARSFGRKLATAALAAFFAHEPKRPI